MHISLYVYKIEKVSQLKIWALEPSSPLVNELFC